MGRSLQVLQEVLERGHAFIPRFQPDVTTEQALSSLGKVVAIEGLDPVQELSPKRLPDAPPNTYSGNFGVDEFPLHTDLAHWAVPPRYVALRCLAGSRSVRTRLFDGRQLIGRFGVALLQRTLVQPRRPLVNGRQLLRVLDEVSNTARTRCLRWDDVYLRPATEMSHRVVENVRRCLGDLPTTDVILGGRGDTIVFDNWRYLHGRSSVGPSAMTRRIARAYLGSLR